MNKQFSKAIMSLAVFALSMNPVHSTHIGIKAGLQILLKAAAVKTNGRDYSPLFKSLGEKNKKGEMKGNLDKFNESLSSITKIYQTSNKEPNGPNGIGEVQKYITLCFEQTNINTLADLANPDYAKSIEDSKNILESLKKSSNGSYDNQADLVDRLRFVLGVNMLFDVSNDGFYKLGLNGRAHFFGNKKFIGDKNSNDFIAVTNPFGFSFGLLGSIGMFHVGVNLAFDKLNADLKGSTSDVLKSLDNAYTLGKTHTNEMKTLTDKVSALTALQLNTLAGVVFPGGPNPVAANPATWQNNTVTQFTSSISRAEEAIKGYSNPFTNSNARIADGMYCSLQGIIGVEFPIFNQDLVSFYADLVINLPLTGVKGVDNSLGHGVEFKRDVSFAIEAGIQVNL